MLDAQKAVVLGAFSAWKKSPQRPRLLAEDGDRPAARGDEDADPHRPAVRPRADQGDAAGRRRVQLLVDGRNAFIGW